MTKKTTNKSTNVGKGHEALRLVVVKGNLFEELTFKLGLYGFHSE